MLRCIATFVFTIVLIGRTFGQTSHEWIKAVSDRKIMVEEFDKLLRETMDSLDVPGLSIAIINDADIVYHRVLGVKNIETNEPVDDETIFEAASLSKPVFAYFFMKMVDKGNVRLDEPIYKLLPEVPIKNGYDDLYKMITPRMVLSHSTGFPNWSRGDSIIISFTPGTDFSYSGEAHQFLTAYLAIVNNTNWQQGLEKIFQDVVAKPLGMKHSYYVGNDYFNAHKATGYENSSPKELWLPKSFGAAHTLHTEALDYAKFLVAMINGDGLSKESYEEMLKEQNHFKDDNDLLTIGQTGWCLGFSMKPTQYGMRYLHTGNNTGFRAYCCFYIDKKYGLVFFMNSDKITEFYEKIGKYLDDEF